MQVKVFAALLQAVYHKYTFNDFLQLPHSTLYTLHYEKTLKLAKMYIYRKKYENIYKVLHLTKKSLLSCRKGAEKKA